MSHVSLINAVTPRLCLPVNIGGGQVAIPRQERGTKIRIARSFAQGHRVLWRVGLMRDGLIEVSMLGAVILTCLYMTVPLI